MSRMIYAGSVGTPASVGKAQKGSIGGIGEGVYSLRLNDDYSLEKVSVVPVDNGGIICISKDKKYVYCANESRNFDNGFNGSGGGVTAFKVNEEGVLEKLNESISYGSRTSYVSVTDDNKYLICSNHGSHTSVVCRYVKDENGKYQLERGYDDSSVALFSLNEDGSIGELLDLKVFTGSGYWIYGGGQSTSHLHSVKQKGDYLVSGNRGGDKVELLKINREKNCLDVLDRYVANKAYAPRHEEFHPMADIVYVANENYPVASVLALDKESGKLSLIQNAATATEEYLSQYPIPAFEKDHCDKGEKNTSAMGDFTRMMPSDVHLSLDCKHLYVSNRRLKQYNATMAVFEVNDDYTIKLVQSVELPGGDPRGFNLIDENHLIVGLCDKNIVCIYELEDGLIGKEVARCEVNSTASFAIGE